MSKNDAEITFKPFSDAVSQSMLNELTFENQGDCVSIYGSLQITADAQGLAYAKQLARIANEAVAYLEKSDFNAEPMAAQPTKPTDTEEQPFNWDE